MTEQPTGTVTLVFTDIKSSTRLLGELRQVTLDVAASSSAGRTAVHMGPKVRELVDSLVECARWELDPVAPAALAERGLRLSLANALDLVTGASSSRSPARWLPKPASARQEI
jgi:hypothetical protein